MISKKYYFEDELNNPYYPSPKVVNPIPFDIELKNH